MNVILDLVTIGILAVCVWKGYRKGFVMSLTGVITLVAAILVGGYTANRYSGQISEYIEPYIGWISNDAADDALRSAGGKTAQSDPDKRFGAITDAFEALGISDDAAQGLAQKAKDLIEQKSLSVRTGISRVFTDALTYILVFMVAFAVTALVFTVLANIVSAAFGLPVLNALNKFGGIALGAVYGLLILFALAWLLRFTGIVISQETLEKTWFVRLFMYLNPIKYMLGL